MTSRLASLLVQENLVAAKTMADAFQRQVIYGGTLDTILLEMNAIAEPQLVVSLAKACALPAAESLPQVDKLTADGVLAWFDAAMAERVRAVPLSIEGSVIRVMTIDPPDRRALDSLAQEQGKTIEPLIAPEHRYVHALALVYDVPVSARFQSLQGRLAKRAAQAPAVVAAPAPIPAPAPKPTPKPTPAPGVAKPSGSDPALRKVVTDIPVPVAAPVHEHEEQLTPRVTPREASAPARVTREIAQPHDRDKVTGEPAEPLSVAEAVKAIDEAPDRDRIFAALCRGARSMADFVVLFTVQAETMTGRVALADRWIGSSTLSTAVLALDTPTPFRTASQGHAPMLAKVGEDTPSRTLLTAIGRRPPLGAALVPIVLRDRTVAMLYADASGKRLAPSALAEFSSLAGAASRAFQRLIMASKGRDYRAAEPTDTAKVVTTEAARGATVAPGGWRNAASDADTSGRLVAVHDTPTARHVPQTGADLAVLFQSVERGDEQSRQSAEHIIALGAGGADRVVARLPGPVRIDRVALRGPTPPLADHGPLLALLARFGELAVPALEPRLEDQSPELRYYATLAIGELGRESHTARVGKRIFDRDAAVRKVAADMLRRQAEGPERTSLLESLRGELPGPERDRQRFAADALGVLGDAPSVPRLIELVKHDDETLRTVAHRALVSITKQDFGTSRWRWRGWWDRHRHEARIEWLFEGLVHATDEIRSSAQQELRAQLPDSFGYQWDAPKRDRDDAKRKWLDWYRGRR